ncbi:MAG: prepilin-type N-terminal cleavage/methylation domain-containing protein [Patescibacteria group bacterium]|jgi:prepilin-type N-terminal cleavage/methylation domain-containing protein
MRLEHYNNKAGFSLVEVVVATAILALLATAVTGVMIYGSRIGYTVNQKQQASALAEEGLEAARNIADNNFSNLVNGTYGLVISGNQWTYSGANDTTGSFTRTTTISTVDANTKSVAVNVSWTGLFGSSSTSATSYLTNWKAATYTPWQTPVVFTSLNLAAGHDGLKLDQSGNSIYLVRSNATVNLIDVSTPSAPTLTSFFTATVSPNNLAVSGTNVFLSSSANARELEIISFATPLSPVYVGSYNAAGTDNATSIAVVGTTAYLTRVNGTNPEFNIINVSTPATPTLTGSLNLLGSANDISVSGSYAYIASSEDTQELQVVNISVPATPSLAGTLGLTGTADATAIVIYGTTVYVGRTDGSVAIISVATPATPTLLGTFTSATAINDLKVNPTGTLVFIAATLGTAEFQAIDVTIPATPTLYSSLNLSDTLYGIVYQTSPEYAFGASADNAAEFQVFSPN